LRMPPDAGCDTPPARQQSMAIDLPARSFLQEVPETAEADEDEVPKLKISILMCAFNEEKTISRATREVLRQEYPCEIELVVVDDGSSDATADLVARVKDPRIILHRHPQNRGKGAALRTAASLATGTHILPFDADLEYLPKDIPRLVEPLLTGRFDVVYGARLFGYNTVYQSFRYALGNKVLTMMTNVLFDSWLSDLHTCLKLIPLETFRNLDLRENGFGLDTEVTATLLRLGIRPFEVPVSYFSRSHAQGKKIKFRDALACLAILLKVRTRRTRRLMAAPSAGAGTRDTAQLEPKTGQANLPIGVASLAAIDAGEQVSEKADAVAAG
jgi:glycosyltransferase involved in cell wall biosynthesis